MRKEAKMLRCTLLYGSVWSTEKKYMRSCTGKFDIIFGIEHRLRKEEMEEQLNKEVKERWRFAADAVRITDERARSEDQQHTLGGVLVAVDSNLGAVVGGEEGAVTFIPGNEGRLPRCAWRSANVCSILRAHGRMVPNKRSYPGSGAEKSKNHKASMADSM